MDSHYESEHKDARVHDPCLWRGEWEETFIEEFDNMRRRAWMACLTPCRAVWQTFHMDDPGQAGDPGTRRVFIIGHWRCERPH